jgi:hypothetical protein
MRVMNGEPTFTYLPLISDCDLTFAYGYARLDTRPAEPRAGRSQMVSPEARPGIARFRDGRVPARNAQCRHPETRPEMRH